MRYAPVVRRILFRAALFLVPASALWALLPLVASRRLGLGSSGYGLLLGALGAGAIVGVYVLSKVRARLSANAVIGLVGAVFSVALAAMIVVRSTVVVVIVLIPAGMVWVAMLATVNTLLQLFLPRWVRARGLSIRWCCSGRKASGQSRGGWSPTPSGSSGTAACYEPHCRSAARVVRTSMQEQYFSRPGQGHMRGVLPAAPAHGGRPAKSSGRSVSSTSGALPAVPE